MFKSKAKQLAHESFMVRVKVKTKAHKRRDYRERQSIATSLMRESRKLETAKAVQAFTGRVKHLSAGHARGWNDLNTKKAQCVISPLQSWIAHF